MWQMSSLLVFKWASIALNLTPKSKYIALYASFSNLYKKSQNCWFPLLVLPPPFNAPAFSRYDLIGPSATEWTPLRPVIRKRGGGKGKGTIHVGIFIRHRDLFVCSWYTRWEVEAIRTRPYKRHEPLWTERRKHYRPTNPPTYMHL